MQYQYNTRHYTQELCTISIKYKTLHPGIICNINTIQDFTPRNYVQYQYNTRLYTQELYAISIQYYALHPGIMCNINTILFITDSI